MMEFAVVAYTCARGRDGRWADSESERHYCRDMFEANSRYTSLLCRSGARRVDILRYDPGAGAYLPFASGDPKAFREENRLRQPDPFFGPGVKHFQATLDGRYARRERL